MLIAFIDFICLFISMPGLKDTRLTAEGKTNMVNNMQIFSLNHDAVLAKKLRIGRILSQIFASLRECVRVGSLNVSCLRERFNLPSSAGAVFSFGESNDIDE